MAQAKSDAELTFVEGSWQGLSLFLKFSLDAGGAVPDRCTRVILASDDRVFLSSHFGLENEASKTPTYVAVLDFSRLKELAADTLTQTRLYLEVTAPQAAASASGRAVTRLRLGKKRAAGSLATVASQNVRLDNATVVVDEADGTLVFYLVGDQAKPASQSFKPRAGRPFVNAAMLSALSTEGCDYAAVAQGLASGSYCVDSVNRGVARVRFDKERVEMPVTLDDLGTWCRPTITMASWSGSRFCFELEFSIAGAKLLACNSVALRASLNLSSGAAFDIPLYSMGETFLATVDFCQVRQSLGLDALASAALSVWVEVNDAQAGPIASASVRIGADRGPRVFRDFISGFCLVDGMLVIPDEGPGKTLVFRLVGRQAPLGATLSLTANAPRGGSNADGLFGQLANKLHRGLNRAKRKASEKVLGEANNFGSDVFRLKNRDDLNNRLLLFAGQYGVDPLFALAEAIVNGCLTTALDYTSVPGKVICKVEAPGLACPVNLDVTTMASVKRSNLLYQGWSADVLDRNRNHDEQFSRLFSMACEFDELCQANGITYYFAYGTLIGALRHKGFIPWDHDVDLFMTRDEYRKLQELFWSGGFPEGAFLEDGDTDKDCIVGFGRYMDLTSSRFNPERPRGYGRRGKAGVFIDIFILLPVEGESDQELATQGGQLMAFLDELSETRSRMFRTKECWDAQEALRNDIARLGRFEALTEWQQRIYTKPDEGAVYYTVPSAASPSALYYRKEWFGTPRRVTLLGHEFSIPANPYPLLEDQYGADWRFYPSDIRVPAETNLFNSLEVPSEVAIDVANADSDCQRLLDDLAAQKRALMQDNEFKRPLINLMFDLGARDAKERRDAIMAQAGVTLQEAVDQEMWGLIAKATAPYFRTREFVMGQRVDLSFPLEPAWLRAALYSQLCYVEDPSVLEGAGQASSWLQKMTSNNRIHRAGNLLMKQKASENCAAYRTEQRQIEAFFNQVIGIRNQIEDGNLLAARQLTDAVLTELPGSLEAQAADLYLRILDARGVDSQALEAICQEAWNLWMKTHEESFAFCYGLASEFIGEASRAAAVYAKLQATTCDGLMKNYCKDAMSKVDCHE